MTDKLKEYFEKEYQNYLEDYLFETEHEALTFSPLSPQFSEEGEESVGTTPDEIQNIKTDLGRITAMLHEIDGVVSQNVRVIDHHTKEIDKTRVFVMEGNIEQRNLYANLTKRQNKLLAAFCILLAANIIDIVTHMLG